MRVLAGILTFLFGLNLMSKSLQKLEYTRLKKWLDSLSERPLFCVVISAVFAFLVQSSTTVVLVIIGLIGGNMIGLPVAFALLLGGNLGTAFYVPLLRDLVYFLFVLGGVFCIFIWIFSARKDFQNIALSIMGVSFVFVGLDLMQLGLSEMTRSVWFVETIRGMQHSGTSLLKGIALTTLLQSSRLTLSTLYPYVRQGTVPLVASIFFIVGANIGTTSTGVLSTLHATVDQKRTALLHVFINFFGMLLFLPIIVWMDANTFFDHTNLSSHTVFWGVHILFNFLSILVFYPLRRLFLKGACLLIPQIDTMRKEGMSGLLESEETEVVLNDLHKEIYAYYRSIWSYTKHVFQMFQTDRSHHMNRAFQVMESMEVIRTRISDNYFLRMQQMETQIIHQEMLHIYSEFQQMQRLHNYSRDLFGIAEHWIAHNSLMSETSQISLQPIFHDTLELLYLCIQEEASLNEEYSIAVAHKEKLEEFHLVFVRNLLLAYREGILERDQTEDLLNVINILLVMNGIALDRIERRFSSQTVDEKESDFLEDTRNGKQ